MATVPVAIIQGSN